MRMRLDKGRSRSLASLLITAILSTILLLPLHGTYGFSTSAFASPPPSGQLRGTYSAALSSTVSTQDLLTTSSPMDTTTASQPINGQHHDRANAVPSVSQTITPWEIIYPHLAWKHRREELRIEYRGTPLYECFPLLRQALETIATASNDQLHQWGLLESSSNNNNTTAPSVLRIEQVVSHTADPLGWLYSQAHRQTTTIGGQMPTLTKDPLLYMQSTVETAVFGAAYTITKPTKGNDAFWNFVAQLPTNAHVYGGERFDQELHINRKSNTNNNTNNRTSIGEDWNEFGATWWILPAVELRVQPTEDVMAVTTASATTTSAITMSSTTTLAVHLVTNADTTLQDAARERLQLLHRLNDAVTSPHARTATTHTLPPVMVRESSYGDNCLDGHDLYEQGVSAALAAFEKKELEKVVLARRMDLQFEADFSALDILRKWKYNDIHEGGNMFYLKPQANQEFFGCTPERLFTIQSSPANQQPQPSNIRTMDLDPRKRNNGSVVPTVVLSEALAGTRPRGTTAQADQDLLMDLFGSLKDRQENLLTANYIKRVFGELGKMGFVETSLGGAENDSNDPNSTNITNTQPSLQQETDYKQDRGTSGFFVRRLRHLQHICQRFSATLTSHQDTVPVARYLLGQLHPTPAVCGLPASSAMEFIRDYEAIGFDRGFYAGPVGYLGRDAADILVAIRSGLVSHIYGSNQQKSPIGVVEDAASGLCSRRRPHTQVSVYAGAGLVPGSTAQGEWAETSLKLGVISSLFPQSPVTLQSAPTPNVAWAAAFVEELVRNGITQFYVCPGSRSTPLVVAIAKAARANVGVVHAVSVHDERGAGFRAVGYGRGANRPAAIITSSGTAIANLYPAIVEAGMDGVPMLILTADRPYENRDTGANQAIDQVKAYSSSYVRWFRDILPPSDDVPVSVALADANQAVTISRTQRGPVHVNIQFRENLAPDAGPTRNDNRVGSGSKFNGFRFTDVPGFMRWSKSGRRWLNSYSMPDSGDQMALSGAVRDVARLVAESKRGIIVVGNIRNPTDDNEMDSLATTCDIIGKFAKSIGFPIIAGGQSSQLRFSSLAVIPFAEHILKNPTVAENLKPDLIIQIGSPLVSTEVPSLISKSMKARDDPVHHVLLHPHHATERADPSFTVSHRISAEVAPFLKALSRQLDARQMCQAGCSSQIAPLTILGRKLQEQMPMIIKEASNAVIESGMETTLTEPEIILALSMMMSNSVMDQSLFLSNSMPIRDAEFFLYPTTKRVMDESLRRGSLNVGTNRGASGIDGIVSSAIGFAESTAAPTTLLIGDMAALHDINSFHALTSGATSSKQPLTTLLVNNDGGGIFSFLPIAKHGSDVSFDEFFGTPTNTFSYQDGLEAFGLPVKRASNFDSFCHFYAQAVRSGDSSVVEAQVVPRESNVAVHKHITQQVHSFVDEFLLAQDSSRDFQALLPVKSYSKSARAGDDAETEWSQRRTLVLLHGWMGDKGDWDEVGAHIAQSLSSDWDVLAVDLPGHGSSHSHGSSDVEVLRNMLGLDDDRNRGLSIDDMARSVLKSLSQKCGITHIDAIVGYSLGGRIAMAMKRLCAVSPIWQVPSLVKDETKLILVSSYPGDLPIGKESFNSDPKDFSRMQVDDRLAEEITTLANRATLAGVSSPESNVIWSDFLKRWYGAPIWGNLEKNIEKYSQLLVKRSQSLSQRGRDLSFVLRQCSPPRNSNEDWRAVHPENTLFLAGELDPKYSGLGKLWSSQGVKFVKAEDSGHALLIEKPDLVADQISKFITSDGDDVPDIIPKEASSNVVTPVASAFISTVYTTNKLKHRMELAERQSGSSRKKTGKVDSLDFVPFSLDVVDERKRRKGVFGIGWGEQAEKTNQMTRRTGFVLQVVCCDASKVGIGEVSPLPGLHAETLDEAEQQLVTLKEYLEQSSAEIPRFDASSVLALQGGLGDYIQSLSREAGVGKFLPSVRAGLEMAILSLASQVAREPLLQALVDNAPEQFDSSKIISFLPLNGLIPRGSGSSVDSLTEHGRRSFPSMKVKIGHQDTAEDASAVSQSLQKSELYRGPVSARIRADANRAWDADEALQFATALEGMDLHAIERLEFVEEPLRKQQDDDGGIWTFERQVHALERWHKHTGILYALDETIADLAAQHAYDFQSMLEEMSPSFEVDNRGCAALVLKPALIGLELSLQLARVARMKWRIGATFSSSFDSGVGLGYTAVLAAVSDCISDTRTYSHGVGTFTLLDGDTLSPSFESYVNDHGYLNILSLSRAFNGLGLDELRNSYVFSDTAGEATVPATQEVVSSLGRSSLTESSTSDYEASTATSSSGREINLVVSLPLPFSAETACARFTDFPQQSRWSPWIRSVRYLDDGRETEWDLNVRGVKFRWRAVSSSLAAPSKGIQWESVSGLKNRGVVEFVATGQDSSLMKVRMSILTPRTLAILFQSTSVFVEDFLRNKLLKWSLENFRDVVKGDLALERGDVELGDALFGSVEGKSSAIEATLSLTPPSSPSTRANSDLDSE